MLRPRTLPLAAAALLAGAGSALAVEGPTSQAVTIQTAGEVQDLAADGAGLRAAVIDAGDHGPAYVEQLDASGHRTALTSVGSSDARFETVGLTPSGAVAAGTKETSRGATSVEAATLENRRSRQQRLSLPGHGALLTSPVAVGPTGAAGLTMIQVTRGGNVPALAFRPAGAHRFRKPVAIAGPQAGGDTGLVVLGPGGGGVVLSLPDNDISKSSRLEPTTLRRISPAGRLGPPRRLRLGTSRAGFASVTAQAHFLRDGTFVAVFSATDATHVRSWFTSLAPRATRPSTPQNLTDSSEAGTFARLGVVEGQRGHVTVLTDDAHGTYRVFNGSPRHLRRGIRLPGLAQWTGLARLADGRAVAYGLGAAGVLTAPTAIASSAGTPLPGFVPSMTGDEDLQLDPATALPDGRLAVPWTTYDGQVASLLLSTPPG